MAKLPDDVIEKIHNLKAIVQRDIQINPDYQDPETQEVGKKMIEQFDNWIDNNKD